MKDTRVVGLTNIIKTNRKINPLTQENPDQRTILILALYEWLIIFLSMQLFKGHTLTLRALKAHMKEFHFPL